MRRMKNDARSYAGSAVGLLLAALFLTLTFRGMDIGHLWGMLRAVPVATVAAMAVASLAGLVLRGLRWYYLLPDPRPGEGLAVQRALALGYGVNNIASRVGELVRIYVMRRDSGRGYAALTASVAADRLAFDSLIFAAMVAFSLAGFRAPLLEAFPRLGSAVPMFVAVTLVGLCGLFLLCLRPHWCKALLTAVGVSRIPFVWTRLVPLIDQLALGLSPMKRPGAMVRLHALNLAAWLAAYANFVLVLDAFDIVASPAQTLMLFTVTSFGFLLPSPGGMGTVHYFMIFGCTTFLGTEEPVAAAAATLCHGVNFLVLSAAAVAAFFIRPRVAAPAPTPAPAPPPHPA